MKTYDEKKTAVRFTARLNDFEGDVQEWKLKFYELWRYQMTWNFAYEIAVRDSAGSGVFVDVVARKAFEKNVMSMMEELGYKNISKEEYQVGLIWTIDREDCRDIVNLYED